jgi:hypothetical protein
MSDDLTTQVEAIVRQMLASPQGLLGRQMYPMLGAGRNQTGRTPCCIVYHDGTNAANSMVAATPGLSHQNTGNWVTMSYNQENHDSGDMVAPTGSAIVIKHPGVYVLTAAALWNTNATGIRGLRFTVDGTTDVVSRALIPAAAANNVEVALSSRPVRINAGSSFFLQAFQDSGGNLSVIQSSFASPWWGAVLVANV